MVSRLKRCSAKVKGVTVIFVNTSQRMSFGIPAGRTIARPKGLRLTTVLNLVDCRFVEINP